MGRSWRPPGARAARPGPSGDPPRSPTGGPNVQGSDTALQDAARGLLLERTGGDGELVSVRTGQQKTFRADLERRASMGCGDRGGDGSALGDRAIGGEAAKQEVARFGHIDRGIRQHSHCHATQPRLWCRSPFVTLGP
jgi:hypothetical protein